MKAQKTNNLIVFLSTFPPRECGIATFTRDLTKSMDNIFSPRIKTKIIAINHGQNDNLKYSPKVIRQIDQFDPVSYKSAAKIINNLSEVLCVNIQHEYGIFGGEYGSYLLEFLNTVNKPCVLTLHTVIPNPEPAMKSVTQAIFERVSQIIVLTENAKKIILAEYSNIDPEKINVVPHGIHPVKFTSQKIHKQKLDLSNHLVVTTFGLISRNKGLEYVIRGLPAVAKKFPNLLYLILGETHPVVKRQEGEVYRKELKQLVRNLDLKKNVRFIDQYLSLNQIIQYLQATDIYISTSLDPHQTVSGTLSYALGTGRCIVSTAFAQAKEVVGSDNGILVDFKNPDDYSNALIKLLVDPENRERMNYHAYSSTRHMLWSNVALSYLKVFQKAVSNSHSLLELSLPSLSLKHLKKITDDFGLVQFSKSSEPDLDSGYTLDDNARALILLSILNKNERKPSTEKLVDIYFNFIKSCYSNNFHFINYYGKNRKPDSSQNDINLNDPNGRAIWALGEVLSNNHLKKHIKQGAIKILDQWVQNYNLSESPRSIAFIIKGLANLDRDKFPKSIKIIEESADFLVDLYKKTATDEWQWFEPILSYCNAVIPESLFIAFLKTKNTNYKKIAIKSLDFLIEKTFHGPVYVPIGQDGWYRQNNQRSLFDQQPEDATAMVHCLRAAYLVTSDNRYRDLMYQTFYWFLGNNILGKTIYNKKTGGCHDALTSHGVNINQGAESTISFLLARLCLDY